MGKKVVKLSLKRLEVVHIINILQREIKRLKENRTDQEAEYTLLLEGVCSKLGAAAFKQEDATSKLRERIAKELEKGNSDKAVSISKILDKKIVKMQKELNKNPKLQGGDSQ